MLTGSNRYRPLNDAITLHEYVMYHRFRAVFDSILLILSYPSGNTQIEHVLWMGEQVKAVQVAFPLPKSGHDPD